MKIIILCLLVFYCTNSGHNYEAPVIIQLGEQTTQIRQLKSDKVITMRARVRVTGFELSWDHTIDNAYVHYTETNF